MAELEFERLLGLLSGLGCVGAELGRGTFGAVFMFHLHEARGFDCVVKLVRFAEMRRAPIDNEVTCMRLVKHAPRVVDVMHTDWGSAIVMEYLGTAWYRQYKDELVGVCGDSAILRARFKGDAGRIAAALTTMCTNLEAANVTHSDLALGNIVMRPLGAQDGPLVARPIDFGMATLFEHGAYPSFYNPSNVRRLKTAVDGYDRAFINHELAQFWAALDGTGPCPVRVPIDPQREAAIVKAFASAHRWTGVA
jgi:serine/threonine protein kinase